MPIEKIHGPDVRTDDIEDVKEYFRQREARKYDAMKKKEVFRTEWHDQMIECSRAMLRRECERLGLPEIVDIEPDKYIFLSAEDFSAALPEGDYHSRAFYSSDFRHAILNVEAPRVDLFCSQLHESIHAASFHDFMVIPTETSVDQRRIGIEMLPPTQSARFRGANEAVTERLRWKLSSVNQSTIQKTLAFTDDEMYDITHGRSYSKYIGLLDDVNDRIAEADRTSRDACWDAWTKAAFTGEIMGMRRVEQVWGEDALRILSRLGYDKQTDAKVFKYFHAKSDDMRSRVRREFLDI